MEEKTDNRVASVLLIGFINLIPFIYFYQKTKGLKGDLQLGMYLFGAFWIVSILLGLLMLSVNIQEWPQKKISNNLKIYAFPLVLLILTIAFNLYEMEFVIYVFINFIVCTFIRAFMLRKQVN